MVKSRVNLQENWFNVYVDPDHKVVLFTFSWAVDVENELAPVNINFTSGYSHSVPNKNPALKKRRYPSDNYCRNVNFYLSKDFFGVNGHFTDHNGCFVNNKNIFLTQLKISSLIYEGLAESNRPAITGDRAFLNESSVLFNSIDEERLYDGYILKVADMDINKLYPNKPQFYLFRDKKLPSCYVRWILAQENTMRTFKFIDIFEFIDHLYYA